jgi:hypothetical protein
VSTNPDCLVINDPMAGDAVHIANARDLGAGAALTLCGFTDVPYSEHDGPPTCRSCIAIVDYCKGLRRTWKAS